ncbi:hypothetical protein ACMFMG_002504 [Clarireedia jacksonii]
MQTFVGQTPRSDIWLDSDELPSNFQLDLSAPALCSRLFNRWRNLDWILARRLTWCLAWQHTHPNIRKSSHLTSDVHGDRPPSPSPSPSTSTSTLHPTTTKNKSGAL